MISYTNLYISDVKMENSLDQERNVWHLVLYTLQCTIIQCTFESEGRNVHTGPKDEM